MSEKMGMLPRTKKDVSEIAQAKLVTARIDLVRAFPFMGFLVMSTEYRFTDDLPTMAATTIGGNKIFVSEDFLLGMNRKERAFVIAHEALHIFLEHIGRQTENNYDPKLWNVAADFCINSYLIELDSNNINMPEIGLYDDRFKSKSADEIYHILLEEADNNPDKATEQYGTPECAGSCGKQPFDHLDKTPMTEAEKAENKQKISAALSQSDIDSMKQMGSGYSDLIRQLELMIESVIPWKTLLQEFITSTVRNRYTYDRVSRKSYHSGIIFPTMTGESIDLMFGVDTSGSMSSKDLNEALTELHEIVEVFDSWKLTLLSCDTQPHVIGEYESEEGDDFTSIDTNMVGGGGTDMAPMVHYANESDEEIAVSIIVTDGYIPTETIEEAVEDIPVIVIVTKDGNQQLELNNCEVVFMNDVDNL